MSYKNRLNLSRDIKIGLCFFIAVFHIYFTITVSPPGFVYRNIHLILFLIATFLFFPLAKSDRHPVWCVCVDIACLIIILLIYTYIYFIVGADDFLSKLYLTNIDKIVIIAYIILILEGTRRTIGTALVCVAIFFLGLVFLTPLLFDWPSNSIHETLHLMMLGDDGIHGVAIMTMVSFMYIFILFSVFLLKTGGGEFLSNLALSLTKRSVAGPALGAVVASGFTGSLSGSAVANVMTTGSITIPLMKKVGYSPKTAGAIEAIASTGGLIMPPVMGLVAFLMAFYLKVSYLEICIAAAIPASLYYLSIALMIYFEAKKNVLRPLDELQTLRFITTMKVGWYFLLPLGVIVFSLMIGRTASFAGLLGIFTTFAVTLIRKIDRLTIPLLLDIISESIRVAAPLAMACGTIGIIMGAITISNVGLKLTGMVANLAGAHLLLALILAAITSLILGMGLTSVAIYMLLSALVIPAIVSLGIAPIAANLFVFYFAAISFVTPPVCIAAFAAASIAKAEPMATGIAAAKLAVCAYVIPFLFVFNTELLFIGSMNMILFTYAKAITIILCIALCIQINTQKGVLLLIYRLIFLTIAALLFPKDIVLNILALSITAIFCFLVYSLKKWRKEDNLFISSSGAG